MTLEVKQQNKDQLQNPSLYDDGALWEGPVVVDSGRFVSKNESVDGSRLKEADGQS